MIISKSDLSADFENVRNRFVKQQGTRRNKNQLLGSQKKPNLLESIRDQLGARVQPIRMHVNDASYCRETWKNDLREQVEPTLRKYYNFKHTELREKFRPDAAAMNKTERKEQLKISRGKTSLLESFEKLIQKETAGISKGSECDKIKTRVKDVIGGKIKRENFTQKFYDVDSDICTKYDELHYCTTGWRNRRVA